MSLLIGNRQLAIGNGFKSCLPLLTRLPFTQQRL
jgi:hypothetical protein